MSGRPNPCQDVLGPGSLRSPEGREPDGDGAPVVVRGRESRPHGEGGQATEMAAEVEVRGMRDAETTLAITTDRHWRAGCSETCTSGSEGGGWKRARRRSPVTA